MLISFIPMSKECWKITLTSMNHYKWLFAIYLYVQRYKTNDWSLQILYVQSNTTIDKPNTIHVYISCVPVFKRSWKVSPNSSCFSAFIIEISYLQIHLKLSPVNCFHPATVQLRTYKARIHAFEPPPWPVFI
jgi:hypothetical protein